MDTNGAKHDRALRAFLASVNLGAEYWYILEIPGGLAHLYTFGPDIHTRYESYLEARKMHAAESRIAISRCGRNSPAQLGNLTLLLPDSLLFFGRPICSECVVQTMDATRTTEQPSQ